MCGRCVFASVARDNPERIQGGVVQQEPELHFLAFALGKVKVVLPDHHVTTTVAGKGLAAGEDRAWGLRP